jgi:hypothetical protein
MTVIEGEENIRHARLYVLKGALKLEIAGMQRHGRSTYSIVKEEFGFKGSKARVLKQLEEYIKFREKQLEINLDE